ncbi:MAG: bifunctional riboflavin kinase/FAD synthetase [Taibaiella sp.]|nr:bifunctional riboflavin kinase/FAD synthetase [Taibaiella sp.]
MAIYSDIGKLPAFHNATITIGTFDGVHSGHRAILNEVVKHARQAGGESVLITFDPHPRKVLFPGQPLGIITPLRRKLELIESTGIDHIVVVPFTPEFAALDAESYVRDFLVGKFRPASLVIGYDHHFGHDRRGDIDLLRELAPASSFDVVEIPAQLIKDAAVSSTKIRNAIRQGHMEDARLMLGHAYSFSGKVVHGKKLGRTLGYPTANLDPTEEDQVLPGNGIYAVNVYYNGGLYGGMMSIGYNPTVDESDDLKIEVNMFDFDADIYGCVIEVVVLKKLREELKFKSLERLIDQLKIDRENSIKVHYIANDN